MEINDKKFNRTKRILFTIISVVLAILLIALSYRIMYDLDSAVKSPSYEEYFSEQQEKEMLKPVEKLTKEYESILKSEQNLGIIIETAEKQKSDEQASFENWNKARGTLGSPSHDKEVISRLKRIDELQVVVQGWVAKRDSLNEVKSAITEKENVIYKDIEKAKEEASRIYYSDLKFYSLKVFGVRLLFVTPILLLGVYFFIKKRKSKFSSLYMGFSLFALYAFFFGLVPYLPSFGGYIRYTVGILLTLGLGYYAIKQLFVYQEKRKSEMKQSVQVRTKLMQGEIASKSFENHVCPSCGKDFIIKGWEVLDSAAPTLTARPAMPSNYCRYCGFQIVKKCSKCNQDNYAHLPFCVNCGDNLRSSSSE